MVAVVAAWAIPSEVLAAGSPVKIGHAVHGERGGLKGNKAGDYKGREIYIENWTYSAFSVSRYHWKYVFRARDHELAKAIASNMKAICRNDKIGYDQNSPDSATLYDKAEAKDWNISEINSRCETTCSNAVSVCLNAEGIDVPKYWNTAKMKQDLMDTGMFECLKAKKYVRSSEKLVVGDILLNPGHHTAVVVESDNPFTYTLTYKNTNGNTVGAQIEEGTYIQINPNNSSEPVRVKMDGNRELTEEEADLKGHVLAGWDEMSGGVFTARFKPERQQMDISGEKVKL